MVLRSKKIATIGAASGLLLGALAFPAAATAAPTECEPDHTNTAVSMTASDFEIVGSLSATNTGGTAAPVTFAVSRTDTKQASVTGGISFETILAPVQASVSATATSSSSWSAGTTIGPVTAAPGETKIATYGFNTVSFSGSMQTCASNGQFGTPAYFSGTAPTGTHVNF